MITLAPVFGSLPRVDQTVSYQSSTLRRTKSEFVSQIVWIVQNQPVAAFASSAATRAQRNAGPAVAGFHSPLVVDILGQLKDFAPVVLIPDNQTPGSHVVADSKAL